MNKNESSNEKKIKVLIAKPGLDGHDRGAKVVIHALKEAGMDVLYTGLHNTVEEIVDTAEKENANIIGMSALLTTTQPVMKQVVEKLKERGLDKNIKTIVGGAPLSSEYADLIGADAYSYDAANAVVSVSELVE